MARMDSRPRTVTVYYRGIAYELDLVACRIAMVLSQVKGELDSMESLANRVDISRSTASRFFSGRPTSLAVTLQILQALHLTFEKVARPVDHVDDGEGKTHGPAGGGVKPQPSPTSGQDATARRLEDSTIS